MSSLACILARPFENKLDSRAMTKRNNGQEKYSVQETDGRGGKTPRRKTDRSEKMARRSVADDEKKPESREDDATMMGRARRLED